MDSTSTSYMARLTLGLHRRGGAARGVALRICWPSDMCVREREREKERERERERVCECVCVREREAK